MMDELFRFQNDAIGSGPEINQMKFNNENRRMQYGVDSYFYS